jgi:hypothetical protein
MKDKEKLRERYMRDPLPRRLGRLAATLARISSSARLAMGPAIVLQHIDEARHLIEWTAAEAEPEIAAELVQTQRLLTLYCHRDGCICLPSEGVFADIKDIETFVNQQWNRRYNR